MKHEILPTTGLHVKPVPILEFETENMGNMDSFMILCSIMLN